MSTILIVEDEPLVQRVFRLVLERSGYELMFADNGEQGLQKMKENAPDLIVTDIMMPIMDGQEMIRRIKEDNSLSEIPVIVTSAVPLDFDLRDFVEAYFPKPVSLEELETLIHEILEARRTT